MTLLAPSVLSADFSNINNQIRSLELGKTDIIHCDIMDGSFVPNLTFGPIIVKAIKKLTDIPLDVHLMVNEPMHLIEPFINAGASLLSFHYEAVKHHSKYIQFIKSFGVKAGIVLNPYTSTCLIEEFLEDIDFVLLMSVNPGFGGQKFIESTYSKIEKLSLIRSKRNLNFLIEIDGGITSQNIRNCAKAGCDIIVAGNEIFKTDNITARVLELKARMQ